MPQEFQVLRCYQCSTFQVHQVKKAKKWSCKMCGEKQSVIKVFGRGTGADCRHHVQKLNSLRGEIEQVGLETPTEPGQDQPEVSNISQTEIGEDSVPSVDRWSRFVTSDQEEEDAAADEEHDDRFTIDMTEYKQKQKTRKRKRNVRHDDYEDESSEQPQFDYRRNQSHAGRRPSWGDNSPGGSYTRVGQTHDADPSDINPYIQPQENQSSQGKYQSTSFIKSTQHYNRPRGQGQRSRLDGYENEGDQYFCYSDDQKGDLFECQSGLSAGNGHGNQVLTEGQPLNRGQGHHQVLTEGQSLKRSQVHQQVETGGQSLNKGQGHPHVVTKGQSLNRGQDHHQGMKNNQNVSKWSKYQAESDSGEETCTLTEQSEKPQVSENFQNDFNTGQKEPAGDVVCVQSREENRENTCNVFGSSVKSGKPKDFLNNTCSLTELLVYNNGVQKQNPPEMYGVIFEDRKNTSFGREYNDYRLRGDNSNKTRGDNSNRLVSLEENPSSSDCLDDSKSVKNDQLDTSCIQGTLHSYTTEHRSNVGLSNQQRSNVFNSKQRTDYHDDNTRPLTQKSTTVQSMFVTDDITDEDLIL